MVSGEAEVATNALILASQEHLVVVVEVAPHHPANRCHEGTDSDEESEHPAKLCRDHGLVVPLVVSSPDEAADNVSDNRRDNSEGDARPHAQATHYPATATS